jgi:hypothetical protein
MQQNMNPLYSCLLGFDAVLMGWIVPDVWKDCGAFTFGVKQLFLDCLTLKLKAPHSFETFQTTHSVVHVILWQKGWIFMIKAAPKFSNIPVIYDWGPGNHVSSGQKLLPWESSVNWHIVIVKAPQSCQTSGTTHPINTASNPRRHEYKHFTFCCILSHSSQDKL